MSDTTAPRAPRTRAGNWKAHARPTENGVVQTSIRMSRGTREALNYIRSRLNATKRADESPWTLGEVIGIAISHAYDRWLPVAAAVDRDPQLQVTAEPKRRRRDAGRNEVSHTPAA